MNYVYYWFRHHADGSTFIALRDEEAPHEWYLPAIAHPIRNMESSATLLGPVDRTTRGRSIDQ